MDIALYIAELLHQYNEINIVGLGTFFKKRISGFYDDRNHVFVPPTHDLAFKLEHHENLILADYCCTQRNISQTTAIYFIEKFVNSIWKQLNTSGYADLRALGILKKTNTGYILEAREETGYMHTFYGLKPVSETNISHYSQIIDEPVHLTHDAFAPSEAHVDRYKQQKSVIKEIPRQEVIIPAEPTKYPSLIIEAKEASSEEKGKPLAEAILAFISLVLLATIGIYYFHPDVYSHFAKLFPLEQPIVASTPKQVEPLADSTIKINPIDTLQKREAGSINQHDTTKTNNINTQAFTSDQTRYEIIVATFGKQSEAEDYVIRLKQKGMVVKILDHTPGSHIRVSYASFTNKQIAETTLIQIRKDISPDAWMAIINPKKS